MYCRCLERAGRGRLLVSASATFADLRILTTRRGHRELPQIMHSSVNMARALPISGIFAHHDTTGIILPYFSGADLSEIETPQ